MTQITSQDGKIVFRDGKVGTGQSCCCGGGACCLPAECWVQLTAIFWSFDENGAVVCPGAPPPPPAGYALVDSICEPGNGRISTFRKTLDPNNPEQCPPDVQAENLATIEHFQQVSNGAGDPGVYSGGNCCQVQNVTARCEGDLSQADCEAQGGTFYGGITCAEKGVCCSQSLYLQLLGIPGDGPTCDDTLTQQQQCGGEVLVCHLAQYTQCSGEFVCDPCPEGYSEVSPGVCAKLFVVDSCDQCLGDVDDEGQFVPPGVIARVGCFPVVLNSTWHPGVCDCDDIVCPECQSDGDCGLGYCCDGVCLEDACPP